MSIGFIIYSVFINYYISTRWRRVIVLEIHILQSIPFSLSFFLSLSRTLSLFHSHILSDKNDHRDHVKKACLKTHRYKHMRCLRVTLRGDFISSDSLAFCVNGI